MATEQQSLSSGISVARAEQLLSEFVSIPSVVGDKTTAHLWMTERLKEIGMTVEHYPVEGRTAPLVFGVIEGDGDGPGVLFDAHFDTVHAVPEDWTHNPWKPVVEDGVLYGRGAVDSKGTVVAMLMAAKAVVDSGRPRSGPIYLMSDSDGEDGFRGAALMRDIGIMDRIGTVWSAEATSNTGVEIAYPGISTWKITAIGKTAHPTEPEHGINAVTKMAKLVLAVDEGRLELPKGDSKWFEPRVTINGIRTRPGGGWAIPGRCDAVLSVLSPAGASLAEVRAAIDAFLRKIEKEDGEVRFERKILPMGAGRLWLHPGESDPDSPGVKALAAAIEGSGRSPEVRKFNGGWVDSVEMMHPGGSGFDVPTTITFGPGDFELAHTVDEHIPLAEVAEAAEIYATATLDLLT
ncbi:MAG TPA: M20/M25/M40 family metallo-hydrolase [Solirubrobacterales bacterium]|jgi:acetylornithine deacetylase/succinyl-diaminopimelate desuccinylase-like protein|nr:M20/M25/M40 family metallo-hydrolase [Solirubrobacterales bacterium]